MITEIYGCSWSIYIHYWLILVIFPINRKYKEHKKYEWKVQNIYSAEKKRTDFMIINFPSYGKSNFDLLSYKHNKILVNSFEQRLRDTSSITAGLNPDLAPFWLQMCPAVTTTSCLLHVCRRVCMHDSSPQVVRIGRAPVNSLPPLQTPPSAPWADSDFTDVELTRMDKQHWSLVSLYCGKN